MQRWHVLLIIALLIGGYILTWHLLSTREIDLLVVDKTVPEKDYREHRAIFWIAGHRRFTALEGELYQADEDYLGYHPETEAKETFSGEDLKEIDLLYLADTYGIYDYEEGIEVYEEKLPYKHQDIELIYGGFDQGEVEAIEDFSTAEERLLIGEHNIVGYPTYLNPEATERLQELFAISYDGWLARYYEDLDQTAYWMKELYTRIYGREWDLQGTGMVFVREDVTGLGWYSDLVIIEQEQFKEPWPVVKSTEHELLAGAAPEAPYLYWMELLTIDEANQNVEILAHYELPVEEESRDALRARGLPDRFPAAIKHDPPGKAKRIYFAGDFADQLPALLPAGLTGSAALQRFISYIPGLPVQYRFYFQWYEPVLHNILETGKKEE
ncbi:MAG: hypothetical protein R6U91_06825 [Bacillota bacterium]